MHHLKLGLMAASALILATATAPAAQSDNATGGTEAGGSKHISANAGAQSSAKLNSTNQRAGAAAGLKTGSKGANANGGATLRTGNKSAGKEGRSRERFSERSSGQRVSSRSGGVDTTWRTHHRGYGVTYSASASRYGAGYRHRHYGLAYSDNPDLYIYRHRHRHVTYSYNEPDVTISSHHRHHYRGGYAYGTASAGGGVSVDTYRHRRSYGSAHASVSTSSKTRMSSRSELRGGTSVHERGNRNASALNGNEQIKSGKEPRSRQGAAGMKSGSMKGEQTGAAGGQGRTGAKAGSEAKG